MINDKYDLSEDSLEMVADGMLLIQDPMDMITCGRTIDFYQIIHLIELISPLRTEINMEVTLNTIIELSSLLSIDLELNSTLRTIINLLVPLDDWKVI